MVSADRYTGVQMQNISSDNFAVRSYLLVMTLISEDLMSVVLFESVQMALSVVIVILCVVRFGISVTVTP